MSLTRKERQALQDQIDSAKAKLEADRANRPKRQLTTKQLENLRRGRELNPHFHPKKDDSNNDSDKQSEEVVKA